MKKMTGVFLCLVVVLTGLAASPVHAGQRVQLAPVQRAMPMPPLRRKEGWLSITNRDWNDYFLEVNNDKIYLHRGRVPGRRATNIPSGATVTIAIEKDSYDMYGETSDRLRVRVREGRTTTVSLEPFGFHNNSGLIGIVNDGDRVRKETLFDTYSAPVIVPAPPPVVIERPRPTPPPVVVHRPPVVVQRPPVVVQPAPVVVVPPRHPAPPPPRRKDDGFSFFFGFDSGKRR